MRQAESAAVLVSRDVGRNRLVAVAPVLLMFGILLAVAANFLLAARQNINWDEFNYLTLVHTYLRGELATRLQTFHVHLFTWLPGLAPNEPDQIVGARQAMAVVAAFNALLIYGIARRFMDWQAALFGLCAYLAMSFVVENGTAFRADPVATLLVLTACFLVVGKPGGAVGAALAGIVMAFAMMITVKSIFYVIVLGLLLLILQESWRGRIRLGAAFGLTVVPTLAFLYWFHADSLAESRDLVPLAGLKNTGIKMFLADGLFPRWRDWLAGVIANPILWISAFVGALTTIDIIRRSRDARERREAWLLLALALPLATPLIYRNAFDYFYVFILPPAAWLAGIAYRRLRAAALAPMGGFAGRVLITIVALQLVFLMVYAGRQWPDRIEPQRMTIAGAHQVFPFPVAYIDGYGAVGSFRRVGFFMSSWGIDVYRAAGEPVFPTLVSRHQPPMLLADSLPLYDALWPGLPVPGDLKLLPEDALFLADNYLQYWGMLFVAGKQLTVPGSGELAFTIAVAGEYRLESTVPVRIDGRTLSPDEVIMLDEGVHVVEAGAAADIDIRLIWAAAQPAPPEEPVDLLTFFGVAVDPPQ